MPALAQEPEIVATIEHFRGARDDVRADLERAGQAAATDLANGLASGDTLIRGNDEGASQSIADAARRLAQVEFWRAVLFAGEVQQPQSPTIQPLGTAPFTGRDTLAWCAAVLEAAGDQISAAKITSYAKIPPEAARLVSDVLAAKPEARADLLADLARLLKENPKDSATAMAVDIVLRRGVGDTAGRSVLDIAARTVADDTVSPLRDTLAARVKAERAEAMKAIIGRGGFPVIGITVDGEEFDAASLLGKDVAVVFWRPGAAACLAELPRLVAAYENLRDTGVEIIMVHTNCVGRQVRDFASRHPDLRWIQLADPDSLRKGTAHPLAIAVGLSTADVPAVMTIDQSGVVQAIEGGLDLGSMVRRVRGTKVGDRETRLP